MSVPKKGKGEPPRKRETRNTSKTPSIAYVDMNFKVDKEFRIEFRNFASNLDISQKDLLIKAFEFYKEHHC